MNLLLSAASAMRRSHSAASIPALFPNQTRKATGYRKKRGSPAIRHYPRRFPQTWDQVLRDVARTTLGRPRRFAGLASDASLSLERGDVVSEGEAC